MDGNKDLNISLGILVSYDYEFLKISMPKIYNYVNFILLAIDKNQMTWKGEQFVIPDSFFQWLEIFDIEKKIHFYYYEVDFSMPSMEIETHLRNEMGKRMPKSDWYMQIDTDEYIINAEDLVSELSNINYQNNSQIMVYTKYLPMFKSDEDNVFLIDVAEKCPVFTNIPKYDTARLSHFAQKVYSEIYFLHQSWDRKEEEILMKIKNWGHNSDFNIYNYFNFWKTINKFNYNYIYNFHPIYPEKWNRLIKTPLINSPNFNEFIKKYIHGKKIERLKREQIDRTLKSRIKYFLLRLFE